MAATIAWSRHIGGGNIDRMLRSVPFLAASLAKFLTASLAVTPAGASAADVPAYVLALPESVPFVLVAETDTATLYRFRRDGSAVSLHDQRYMSIGENGVGKSRAWDRRTPLGLYFITDQLDTSRLPPRYGASAFPLDYPNTLDRMAGRTGDGIWIHGVDPAGGHRPPFDTDGCLALGNDDLLTIAPGIIPLVTPVVITRKLERATQVQLQQRRSELLGQLDRWARALESGDLHGFVSLYDESFSFHGVDRRRWLSLQLGRFEKQRFGAVEIDEIVLLKDPVETDLYLSRFRQTVETDGAAVSIMRRLYWRRSGDGGWRIVAEDNG